MEAFRDHCHCNWLIITYKSLLLRDHLCIFLFDLFIPFFQISIVNLVLQQISSPRPVILLFDHVNKIMHLKRISVWFHLLHHLTDLILIHTRCWLQSPTETLLIPIDWKPCFTSIANIRLAAFGSICIRDHQYDMNHSIEIWPIYR